MVERYTVRCNFDGCAEDALRAFGFSGTMISALRKELGLIRILREGENGEGTAVFATARVRTGDLLVVSLPVNPVLYPASGLSPEFVYDDEDVAVIVKPCGVATVPVRSHYKDSLASVLGSVWGAFVYRPVGRLDKDTSGLIAVAKNALAAKRMRDIQLAGMMVKKYTALTEGMLPESGEIDAPIALSADSVRREVNDSGKPAKTLFRRIASDGARSLVEFTLLTGRTHQIRVHSAYAGHPLVGDRLYNPDGRAAERLMLHCSELSFPHPRTGIQTVCKNAPTFSLS